MTNAIIAKRWTGPVPDHVKAKFPNATTGACSECGTGIIFDAEFVRQMQIKFDPLILICADCGLTAMAAGTANPFNAADAQQYTDTKKPN